MFVCVHVHVYRCVYFISHPSRDGIAYREYMHDHLPHVQTCTITELCQTIVPTNGRIPPDNIGQSPF